MKKYTYKGKTQTTKIITNKNGKVESQTEEIIVDWGNNDVVDK